jgi:hypothetical protein
LKAGADRRKRQKFDCPSIIFAPRRHDGHGDGQSSFERLVRNACGFSVDPTTSFSFSPLASLEDRFVRSDERSYVTASSAR